MNCSGCLLPGRFSVLIGGDKFDDATSWYYINAARPVYTLYGQMQNIGYLKITTRATRQLLMPHGGPSNGCTTF